MKRMRISRISETGPGYEAGLRAEDVICFYDGADIHSNDDLADAMDRAAAAKKQKVAVVVWRNRRAVSLEIPPGPMRVELRETDFSIDQRLFDQDRTAETFQGDSFPAFFRRHQGETVQINAVEPLRFEDMRLAAVGEDHFVVQTPGMFQRIPYRNVLQVAEPLSGKIAITVFHLVIYKGAVGFGFSIPFESD